MTALAALTAVTIYLAQMAREEEAPARPMPAASGGDAPLRKTSFLSRLIPPPPEEVRGPRAPRSLRDLARRLPSERKVAQLFLWGFDGTELTSPIFRHLTRLDLGGIVIAAQNFESREQLRDLAGEAGVVARQARHVPPWVFAAQEGGDFNEFDGLPPGPSQAEIRTAREAGLTAFEGAAALRPLGISGVLAPVADVAVEDGGFLASRAYSDETETVARFTAAAVAGYRRGKTFAAVKHFPGLGGATHDPAEGPAPVGLSVEELAKRDLVPFAAAIRAGVPGVVVGHGSYATDDFVTPASLSRQVATVLLRERLGFRGVAIADDLASPAVASSFDVPDAAVEAIKAGVDMVFVSGGRGDQEAAYTAVLNALRKGDIPRARVDEAVLRILQAKADYGLISDAR